MQSNFQLPIYILEYTVVPESPTYINYWLGAYIRNSLLYAASSVYVSKEASLRDIVSNKTGAVAEDSPKGYALQCDPIFFNSRIDDGDSLKFRILLFGKFIQLRDSFHQSVVLMCKTGIGHPKVRLRIESFSFAPVPKLMENKDKKSGTYRIDFITPTSLFSNRAKSVSKQGLLDKQNGMPNFYYMILYLTRRLNRIGATYGDGERITDEEIDLWCEKARKAQVEECTMRRLFMSGTPKKDTARPIYFSGYVGSLTISNVDRQYLQLLHLGQYMNVGNDAVYGLGQYEIEEVF